MQCSVSDCDRVAQYKAAKLCQKHYFRLRRTGTTSPRRPKPRLYTPNGYVLVYDPQHPLAESKGYVFEHRKVAYDNRSGKIVSCEACAKVEISWKTCHVDHVDEDRKNNAPSNLRVTCIGCNVMRGHNKPRHTYAGRTSLTYDGITQTAAEWSRDPRVSVSCKTIRRRKAAGMTDAEALFGAKKTHVSKRARSYSPKFEGGKRVRA